MKKLLKTVTSGGRYLAVSLLTVAFFATSLGLNLSFRANGAGREIPSNQSPDAAAPGDADWPSAPPWPLEFVKVAAGDLHSLAITASGALYSFGYNHSGQLGLGHTTQQSTPQLVMSGTKFSSIAAGDLHSLAITASGALYSFGYNYYGQLGLGDTTDQSTPQPVMSGTTFSAIAAAGTYHSLAITTSGTLYSFGYNDYGQLGLGTTTGENPNPTPQPVMSGTTFSAIAAAGHEHSLAITTSGALYSFGRNNFGQLGLGAAAGTGDQLTPRLVALPPQPPWPLEFVKVAAGSLHSLAITATGALYSFGYNYTGQLGLGTSGSGTDQSTPQLVMSGTTFSSVAATGEFSLAITTDGDLYSFGYNDYGQLGLNNTTTYTTPQPVMSGTKFAAVAAGVSHSLALTASGDLFSFGYNSSGQLGLGTSGSGTNQTAPQFVMSGTKFSSIAAGHSHSLAITDTGALYSFGNNSSGQLGLDNTTTPYTTPQLVMNGTTFSSVSAGVTHSLALATTGDLYSFGQNNNGQLGLGTPTTQNESTPQLVMSGTFFSSVSAGSFHSLALTTTGDLYSFGSNTYGQLGLGTNGSGTDQSTPQLVMSGTTFSSIEGGGERSFALTTGALYSFGRNNRGQLGLGTPTTQNESTPKLVAMRPASSISTSFTSTSSALSRISIDEQEFVVESSLKIDNGGQVSIIFQSAAEITKIDIDTCGETFSFTQFNVQQDINGTIFVCTSTSTKQVSMQISNITADLTITATTTNTWQLERFLNWPPGTGEPVGTGGIFIIDGSYVAATAGPNSDQIPTGLYFQGWFTQPTGGTKITALTKVSNISNWNIVNRVDRLYAQWGSTPPRPDVGDPPFPGA